MAIEAIPLKNATGTARVEQHAVEDFLRLLARFGRSVSFERWGDERRRVPDAYVAFDGREIGVEVVGVLSAEQAKRRSEEARLQREIERRSQWPGMVSIHLRSGVRNGREADFVIDRVLAVIQRGPAADAELRIEGLVSVVFHPISALKKTVVSTIGAFAGTKPSALADAVRTAFAKKSVKTYREGPVWLLPLEQLYGSMFQDERIRLDGAADWVPEFGRQLVGSLPVRFETAYLLRVGTTRDDDPVPLRQPSRLIEITDSGADRLTPVPVSQGRSRQEAFGG